jgi:tRNA methyltransferase complex GCD14 subunit
MDDVVTIQHRNVCKDGFTIVDEADAGACAALSSLWLYNSSLTEPFLKNFEIVFLDLPAPWDAVEYAKLALRVRLLVPTLPVISYPDHSKQKDRVTRICCFSPCMEQVLRTVSALNEAGFTGKLFPYIVLSLSLFFSRKSVFLLCSLFIIWLFSFNSLFFVHYASRLNTLKTKPLITLPIFIFAVSYF